MLKWIILDTQDVVDECIAVVASIPGQQLVLEDVVSSIVSCTFTIVDLDEDFIAFKRKLTKALWGRVTPEGIDAILTAIENLASQIFTKIKSLNVYSNYGILWYEYDCLFHGNIVLKSFVTMEDLI